MSCQSLTNFTVLLVCTWIVFSVKVQGILLEEVPPCRELLASIPITFTDVLEVKVNLTKLQECIELWTEWRNERVLIGGFSVPSPVMLTKELDRMLTQQTRQTNLERPVRPEQVEQPNVVVEVQQPLVINKKRHGSGQVGQSKAKLSKVEPPAKASDFVQKPLLLIRYQKSKSLHDQHDDLEDVQQPPRTKANVHELWRELVIIRRKGGRYHTKDEDCIELVNTLLAKQNLSIPIGRYLAAQHSIIVHDCVKAWERLRDKTGDVTEKQAFQHELELLQARLAKAENEFNHRHSQSQKKSEENEKILKRECALLVGTLPHNPRNLVTMVQMLEYKAQLDKCIVKWEQLVGRQNERVGLDVELEQLRTELDRVKDLISGQRPNGGRSNRNFDIPRRHRSKHSKKVRNRMVNDLQDEYPQMVKCEKLIRSIPNCVQASLYYALLQYWTNLVDCIEMWEKLNGEARHTRKQKAIRTKELERMRTEKARVGLLINENTLGRVPNVPLTDENVAALNEDIEPESPLNPGPLSHGSLNSEPPSSSDSVKAELNELTVQLDECKRSFATLKPHEVGECARIDSEVSRINGRMLELEQIKLQKVQDNKKKVEQWMESIPQDGVGHVQGPVLVQTGTKPNRKRPVDGGQGSQLVAKRPKVMSLKPVIPLQWSNLMPRPQATGQQLNEAIRQKVYKPVPGFGKKSPGSNHSD